MMSNFRWLLSALETTTSKISILLNLENEMQWISTPSPSFTLTLYWPLHTPGGIPAQGLSASRILSALSKKGIQTPAKKPEKSTMMKATALPQSAMVVSQQWLQTSSHIPWAAWTYWVAHTTAWGRCCWAWCHTGICSHYMGCDPRSSAGSPWYPTPWSSKCTFWNGNSNRSRSLMLSRLQAWQVFCFINMADSWCPVFPTNWLTWVRVSRGFCWLAKRSGDCACCACPASHACTAWVTCLCGAGEITYSKRRSHKFVIMPQQLFLSSLFLSFSFLGIWT